MCTALNITLILYFFIFLGWMKMVSYKWLEPLHWRHQGYSADLQGEQRSCQMAIFHKFLPHTSSICICFFPPPNLKCLQDSLSDTASCQTTDCHRCSEKCCANEIVWPTFYCSTHFSRDTERAFIQVNHDWSLKWEKRGFSQGRRASIIYHAVVARHLGYNAALQAYKTHNLLGAGKAIVVCFELVFFHPYWQMKKNMSPKGSQARTEIEKDGAAEKQWWRDMFV